MEGRPAWPLPARHPQWASQMTELPQAKTELNPMAPRTFGDHDSEGADPAAVFSTAAGEEKEEHDDGTATGPPSCEPNSDSLPHRLCSMDLCEVCSPPESARRPPSLA